MMNKSFKWADTVFQIDQVNIGTMNILESDITQHSDRQIIICCVA